MHSLKIIVGGFVLLSIFLIASHLVWGQSHAHLIWTCASFMMVWLILAIVNMWRGVSRAGYSLREEFPIFLLVYSVPSAVSLVLAVVTSK